MQLTTKQKVGIGAVVVAGTLVSVMLFLFLMTHPVAANRLRDVSIIILAVTLIVVDIVMMLMLWQVIKLLTFLLTELKPILDSVQDTSSTVKGTATFVSEGVTSPIIDAKAKAAGMKASMSYVMGSFGLGGQRQAGSAPAGSAGSPTRSTDNGSNAAAGSAAQQQAKESSSNDE